MIEIRCIKCHKFFFEASEDATGTFIVTCPRCKSEKHPDPKRTIKLPFASASREKPVAVNEQPR